MQTKTERAIADTRSKLERCTDEQLTAAMVTTKTRLSSPLTSADERQVLEVMRSCLIDVIADRMISRLGISVPIAA